MSFTHFQKLLLTSLFFAFCLFPVYGFSQNLYVIQGKNGSKTFSTKKPKRGVKYKVIKANKTKFSRVHRKSKKLISSKAYVFVPKTSQYDKLIIEKALYHGVHPALVKAVIHVESAFRPLARSPKGALGLMQLMPATAKRFGVKDRSNPKENIEGGVKYLRWLLEHFEGNTKLAIASYNAGENAVKRYKGVPPYKETQNYVIRVSEAFKKYHLKGFG